MAESRPTGDIKLTDARRAREKAAIRKPSAPGSYIAANERIPRRGKTFDKGKGEAVLPKNVPTTERGVVGGSGVQGYGYGRKGNYQLGKNAEERRTFAGGDSNPPVPKAKPATDKSRLAGKKADKVVQGSAKAATPAKKVSDFALATRRGTSDEYTKAKMRPKGNLLSLFKSKASNKSTSSGAAKVKPLTSSFAKKNLAANQKIGKKQ